MEKKITLQLNLAPQVIQGLDTLDDMQNRHAKTVTLSATKGLPVKVCNLWLRNLD